MSVDRGLAFHEAGHAVIAHQLGLGIEEIVMHKDPDFVNVSYDGEKEPVGQFLMGGKRRER